MKVFNRVRVSILFAFVVALLGSNVFAHPTEAESGDSEFKLDRNLLDQIYDSAVNRSSERKQDGLGMGIGISILNPREFVLSNSYYDISWGEANRFFPMPYVSIGSPLVRWEWGGLSWSARGGYTYREGLQTLVLKQGGASSRDFLRMHWASGAGRLELSFNLPWVKPVLYAGAGGQWIFQVGRIDGVNQSYLIPTMVFGSELVLFDQSQIGGSSFSGVRLGVGQVAAVATSQKFTSLTFDCSAAFVF